MTSNQNEPVSNNHRRIIAKYHSGIANEMEDRITVESPLEIRLKYYKDDGFEQQNLLVTMRTPGEDIELAIGFLYSQGLIPNLSVIEKIQHLETWPGEFNPNTILVTFIPSFLPNLKNQVQFFPTTSSCGICGKLSVEAMESLPISSIKKPLIPNPIPPTLILRLPDKMKTAQAHFNQTGSLHGAALFDQNGELITLREDVGRHNALDKLLGYGLQNQINTFSNHLLLLSGRISFELIRKACRMQCPVVAAIGAPSSMAIELAELTGITLVGFIKKQSFNVYTHFQKIDLAKRVHH